MGHCDRPRVEQTRTVERHIFLWSDGGWERCRLRDINVIFVNRFICLTVGKKLERLREERK